VVGEAWTGVNHKSRSQTTNLSKQCTPGFQMIQVSQVIVQGVPVMVEEDRLNGDVVTLEDACVTNGLYILWKTRYLVHYKASKT
jgi:hypothetical protein